MTTKIKRCRHCEIDYFFIYSGLRGQQSDIYCPDCYRLIVEALKDVPIKVKKLHLPVCKKYTNVDVNVFKEHYENYLKNNKIGVKRLLCGIPDNFNYKNVMIDGMVYFLYINRNTGEELLCMNYEVEIETDRIIDVEIPLTNYEELLKQKEDFFKRGENK